MLKNDPKKPIGHDDKRRLARELKTLEQEVKASGGIMGKITSIGVQTQATRRTAAENQQRRIQTYERVQQAKIDHAATVLPRRTDTLVAKHEEEGNRIDAIIMAYGPWDAEKEYKKQDLLEKDYDKMAERHQKQDQITEKIMKILYERLDTILMDMVEETMEIGRYPTETNEGTVLPALESGERMQNAFQRLRQHAIQAPHLVIDDIRFDIGQMGTADDYQMLRKKLTHLQELYRESQMWRHLCPTIPLEVSDRTFVGKLQAITAANAGKFSVFNVQIADANLTWNEVWRKAEATITTQMGAHTEATRLQQVSALTRAIAYTATGKGTDSRASSTRGQFPSAGREGVIRKDGRACYMWVSKGMCKFGNECRFDHIAKDRGRVDSQAQTEKKRGREYAKGDIRIKGKKAFTAQVEEEQEEETSNLKESKDVHDNEEDWLQKMQNEYNETISDQE
jgi:hypothetical protein